MRSERDANTTEPHEIPTKEARPHESHVVLLKGGRGPGSPGGRAGPPDRRTRVLGLDLDAVVTEPPQAKQKQKEPIAA